jgi:hypothetical protein
MAEEGLECAREKEVEKGERKGDVSLCANPRKGRRCSKAKKHPCPSAEHGRKNPGRRPFPERTGNDRVRVNDELHEPTLPPEPCPPRPGPPPPSQVCPAGRESHRPHCWAPSPLDPCCNNAICSQAAKISHRRNEPRNTRNTRNPEPSHFSFRVVRGCHFGGGFAALGLLCLFAARCIVSYPPNSCFELRSYWASGSLPSL